MQLDSAKAKVLVVGGLLIGFLGRWWHIVAELEDELHILAAVAIEVVVFGYVAEVGWVVGVVFDGAVARMEALASAPIGKGSRWCIGAPRVFPFLY
jgi:hypothetical protein